MDVETRIKEYAQYVADSIDATIFCRHAFGLSLDDADRHAQILLRDKGWNGRKYPLDYFTYPKLLEGVTE